jgi:carbon-monoxide dehydrogenase medium subunit
MYPSRFDYHRPTSIEEALSLLATLDDAKLLAGGHSLVPMMKLRLAQPAHVVSLRRVPDLTGIAQSGELFIIGAMTTHRDVAFSHIAKEHLPLLAEVASGIADPQVRNLGTIGGSIAHADPAADYPAALLALDAKIVCVSNRGRRTIPAAEFFLGLFTTALAEDELIVQIIFDRSSSCPGCAYVKIRNPASRFARVGAAVQIRFSAGLIEFARIAVTGVSDRAYRCEEVEEALANVAFAENGMPESPSSLSAACSHVGRCIPGASAEGEMLATAAISRAVQIAAARTKGGQEIK